MSEEKTLLEDAPEGRVHTHFDGYIACIGASAGGLDALERFFKACPSDSGMSFVVIQHLSPDHKSVMNNLLARHTEMPVIMVEDAMLIEANTVYLIPPGVTMHISFGHLHLTPKRPRGLTLPIDIFFSSLAEVYASRAIGIVLSGTGTDGTRGAQAINAAGGFLLAQDPESAKFDGMPRSVIATGLVDAVLAAEDLPARMIAHVQQLPYAVIEPVSARTLLHADMPSSEVLAAILQLLHQVSGIDFADYKPATILRRIERRMQVCHTPHLHNYLDYLERDRSELLNLRREMLISVTSFFRDPLAFEALYQKVIIPLVTNVAAGSTLRVWTAGVASGEEAYTLAMLFLEAFEQQRRWPNLKIFATDVDQRCIEVASAGQYPESTALDLSLERLERFFVKKGDTFVVKNEVRQCIVFARHNLLFDPPFTKMDIVVCRNTLIYFKSAAQERVLRGLQYAVRDGGALLLGSSEALSGANDGMQVLDAKQKLYARKGASSLPYMDRKISAPLQRAMAESTRKSRPERAMEGGLAEVGVAALLTRFAPPSMIVNEAHEVVHLYGDISTYFRLREGTASLEIPRLLPESLVPVASALLYKVARDKVLLTSDPVEVALVDGSRRNVCISVQPLKAMGSDSLALMSFHIEQKSAAETINPVDVDAETIVRVQTLERELAASRESLQATIEELETSNEELQATNEELMASNEELQSSNEELQSVNEEMSTVNAEFQERMQILNRANADLDSLARAVGVATVFVDSKLHITRFSPDALQLFKLRDSDVGRHLDDIQHVLEYGKLMDDLQHTLLTDRLTEREVQTRDGLKTYLMRILPYTVPSSSVRGAVASFVDVTSLHAAKRLQTVVDALPEHVAVVDLAGKIVMVNAAWRRFAIANGDSDQSRCGVGVNYLSACHSELADDDAGRAARGLRGVLEGSLPHFQWSIPATHPQKNAGL